MIPLTGKRKEIVKSLIRKALTSATNVGEALVPEKLEEIITNTIVRMSPELAVIRARYDPQKVHEFNRLTALPAAGSAMGEGAVTPERNAMYARDTVTLKVYRKKGSVTNFLQDASANYIDAAAVEMENHLTGLVYDLNTDLLWGNELANVYAFGGLDRFVATNRIREAAPGTVPTTLNFLDEMLDRNLEAQGEGHPRVFMMSARMLSKISNLLTNVRLNQGLTAGGLTQVNIGGGWRLNAYRDIPIITTSALRPQVTMGTVTATPAGSGTITNDEYFIRVAPVTYNGEELASAEATTGVTSSAATVTLAWTAITGALYYKIYCGLTTGQANTTLVAVIPAFAYDGAGTLGVAVTGYVWTNVDPNVALASAPSHMQADTPYIATGDVPQETVMLWDLHEHQGMGKVPYTNRGGAKFNGLVTIKPLAETDDWIPFLIKSYLALAPAFERSCVIHRGLRVA